MAYSLFPAVYIERPPHERPTGLLFMFAYDENGRAIQVNIEEEDGLSLMASLSSKLDRLNKDTARH